MVALASLAWHVFVACGDGGAHTLDAGGDDDRRYALELRLAAAGAEEPGEALELRVNARPGWHVAPEAEARLELEAAGGARFDPQRLVSADAERLDESGLSFHSRLHREGSARQEASGNLRFGICEGEDGPCQIVRRELRFRLPGR